MNTAPFTNGAQANPFLYGRAPGESPVDNTTWDDEDKGPFHVYEQLPSYAYKVEWTKPDVDAAIRQHEMGVFQSSAVLADAMTRDDAVTAVLDARIEGLHGLDRVIEPNKSGNKAGNKRIADITRDRFEEFFPRGVLAPMKRWEILMGFSIAQIVYKITEKEWLPQLDVWHPAYTYVRSDTHQYYALTSEGPVEVIPGTGQWVLYAPRGTRYAWMNGAIRSIATPWLARSYTWRDWLRYNEMYALGIRKAIVPESADAGDKRKFFSQIASLGSSTTVLVPKGTPSDGKDFDVQVLFPPGTGSSESFEKLLSKSESKIAIRINGQNLTTEVKSGSFAAAKVHENVMDSILQSDSSSIGECLGTQVLMPYIGFHKFPDDTRPPSTGWNTASPEDTQARATGVQKVGESLTLFQTAGAPVDARALMHQFDIPVLVQVDDAPVAPALPKQPAVADPASATDPDPEGKDTP